MSSPSSSSRVENGEAFQRQISDKNFLVGVKLLHQLLLPLATTDRSNIRPKETPLSCLVIKTQLSVRIVETFSTIVGVDHSIIFFFVTIFESTVVKSPLAAPNAVLQVPRGAM